MNDKVIRWDLYVVLAIAAVFTKHLAYGQLLYISDAEAGSVRTLNLTSGSVSSLCPTNSLVSPNGMAVSCSPLPTIKYQMLGYFQFEPGASFLAGMSPWTTPESRTSDCIVGGCAYLNVSRDQLVRLNGPISYGYYSKFSICVWYKPSGTNTRNYQRLFDFGTGVVNGVVRSEIQVMRTGTTENMDVGIFSNYTNLMYASGITGGFASQKWSHFCLSVSGTAWSIYLNGTLRASGSMARPLEDIPFTAQFIGLSQYGNDVGFEGTIDEFRIYRKALAQEEVSTLFQWRGMPIVDSRMNLVVAESGKNAIRVISSLSGSICTLAGGGDATTSAGFRDGTDALFRNPTSVAISRNGSFVVVADTDNYAVRTILTADGSVSTLAGIGQQGFIDGAMGVGRFQGPVSVAISADESKVFVVDRSLNGPNGVRVVDIMTGSVQTLAGSGTYAGVGLYDSFGSSAKFADPFGATISPDGVFLYLADLTNRAIRRVNTMTRQVATLAGGNGAGFQDGSARTALFGNYMSDVALSPDGLDLLVADPSNSAIRRLGLTTGVVSTVAGGSWGVQDGQGPTAGFKAPRWVATSSCGRPSASVNALLLSNLRFPPLAPGDGPCERPGLTWQVCVLCVCCVCVYRHLSVWVRTHERRRLPAL